MQFIDLEAQQQTIRDQLEGRIRKVLDHGQYIMGPEVAELEERLADFVEVRHCVAVSSGTDSLLIALMALEVGPGDEVITTPFSFIATAEVIALLGAKPVFVDIDPRTCNIAPGKIESAITARTRAIIPVSLYGQCADLDAINTVADRYGLPVIEDAAQSFGALYNGRRSCALSTFGSTSFFPSKPLGGYGDGGALFTNDDDLANRVRAIRVHGQTFRYQHPVLGVNGRMDTLQAAVLLAKLELFPQEIERRARIGEEYTRLLTPVKGVSPPYVESHNSSVYAQYTIRVDHRDRVIDALSRQGIPTAVHYPVPLHRQPVFAAGKSDTGSLPEAESAARRVLSLPMHPNLSPEEQVAVVEAVAAAVNGR